MFASQASPKDVFQKQLIKLRIKAACLLSIFAEESQSQFFQARVPEKKDFENVDLSPFFFACLQPIPRLFLFSKEKKRTCCGD